jgi:YebC/PmpR family DNA-binding regulatory protein
MAGHSQFKNIMYRKGAQDKKRAKLFTKATREIMTAVKEAGSDPESNARLRSAIIAARDVNMPKDNIERAIKRAQGGDDDTMYNEIRYEGYGPGGVAIIVDALTDNRNRSASEIRSTFTKYGGNLGETNSVSFQFEHVGEIVYLANVASADQIFEAALEAGALDVQSTATEHEIMTSFDQFHTIRNSLEQKFGHPERAGAIWKPKMTVQVTEQNASTLIKLIETLEDNDDVQTVSANYEIDEALLQKLSSQ